MKTTLGALALAAVAAAAGLALIRPGNPPTRPFLSPGGQSGEEIRGGFSVRGRVLHDGVAVPGARVRLASRQSAKPGVLITAPTLRQTQTDEAGAFTLTDVPEGPGRLIVISDRLAPSTMTVEVRPDSAGTDVEVLLQTGSVLEGRVSSGDGPVAGAHVSVMLRGSDAHADRRPLREGTTDADGRYRLEGLDPVRPLRLIVLAEGYRPFEKSFRNPIEASGPIDLDPGLQVSGRVATATGDPIAGASVQANQGEAYAAETLSGSAGEIRLGGLIARPLSIRVFLDGFAPARLELSELSDGWTIILRRNGGVAGQAPPGSWLVIDAGGSTYRRKTDADGAFRWEGLPPGPAEARATDKAGRILASRKVEIPEGEVAGGILLAP